MYLSLEPSYLNSIIKKAIKKVSKLKFDSIAYTGHSGALVAIPMAIAMKKNLIIIRKPHEKSHGATVEKSNTSKICLIVDDFIDTGKTVKRILKYLKKSDIKTKAVLLYDPIKLINPEEI